MDRIGSSPLYLPIQWSLSLLFCSYNHSSKLAPPPPPSPSAHLHRMGGQPTLRSLFSKSDLVELGRWQNQHIQHSDRTTHTQTHTDNQRRCKTSIQRGQFPHPKRTISQSEENWVAGGVGVGVGANWGPMETPFGTTRHLMNCTESGMNASPREIFGARRGQGSVGGGGGGLKQCEFVGERNACPTAHDGCLFPSTTCSHKCSLGWEADTSVWQGKLVLRSNGPRTKGHSVIPAPRTTRTQ